MPPPTGCVAPRWLPPSRRPERPSRTGTQTRGPRRRRITTRDHRSRQHNRDGRGDQIAQALIGRLSLTGGAPHHAPGGGAGDCRRGEAAHRSSDPACKLAPRAKAATGANATAAHLAPPTIRESSPCSRGREKPRGPESRDGQPLPCREQTHSPAEPRGGPGSHGEGRLLVGDGRGARHLRQAPKSGRRQDI